MMLNRGQEKHYSWPPRGIIAIYDGREREIIQSRDRLLDLSDTLMYNHRSRTVFLTLKSNSKIVKYWNEELVSHYENLMRYDLGFDGFGVSISRETAISGKRKWSSEFRWKLRITTLGSRVATIKSSAEEENTTSMEQTRKSTPSRYRAAKSDASIQSIQKTIERKFDLPKGSVRLNYPNGRKARSDSTVGVLRKRWGV